MDFSFVIHKPYLLVHALNARQPIPFPEWKIFKQGIEREYPKLIKYFADNRLREIMFLYLNTETLVEEFGEEVEQLIERGLSHRAFERLYRETEEYRTFVERQWNQNKKEVLSEFYAITGLKLPDEDITVYITHPALRNGVTLSRLNSMCWGHPEDWKNYTTVYLCHELLHILTAERRDSEVMHAIIELACDNELRIRLNGKGEYFNESGKRVGHSELLKIEKQILPHWRKYLKKGKKDILEFETLAKHLLKK